MTRIASLTGRPCLTATADMCHEVCDVQDHARQGSRAGHAGLRRLPTLALASPLPYAVRKSL